MKDVVQISLYITPELILELEDYRHDHRYKTRNAAIIALIKKGLSQPIVVVKKRA